LYKFVVDGEWTTDHQADKEDDGHSNINNVLHPENIKKAPSSAAISSAAPGSTTAALAGGVPKESDKLDAPGAFPETPANELDQTLGVNPIPASSGAGNPVSTAPGEKLPENLTTNTVDSTATTSKEDYDKAGTGEFPGSGKEEGTFSVNPIPASSGIGNPVQTKPGEGVPEQVTTNTVDSTVTTSKEDYEKAGSYSIPVIGAAAGSALAGAAAAIGFGSKQENEKKLIPESSLPMGEDATKTLDAGPHIQSSGPNSTTAGLAAAVPLEKDKVADGVPEPVKESLAAAHESPEAAASPEAVKEKSALEKELLSKTTSTDATGESAKAAEAQSSYHGLATTVPAPVEKSMEEAKAAPEAAADASVVAEKSQVEKELQSKVSPTDATGEPAPTETAATSAVAPGTTAAATSSGAEPAVAGLADEPAVKMMNQVDSGTAPATTSESKPAATDGATDAAPATETKATEPATPAKTKEEPKTATPASTTTTPSKKPEDSESGSATKDKKKKHRISSFFKKIFD
jgi:hypothetical protein